MSSGSMQVQVAEPEDCREQGAQADHAQDRIVPGADATGDLAIADCPINTDRYLAGRSQDTTGARELTRYEAAAMAAPTPIAVPSFR